jgi:hypothetical protein
VVLPVGIVNVPLAVTTVIAEKPGELATAAVVCVVASGKVMPVEPSVTAI